jgi:branched-chain amino acid transport system substrate-binding protein
LIQTLFKHQFQLKKGITMKLKNDAHLVLMLAVTLLLAVVPMGSAEGAKLSGTSIKVGVIVPLSGPAISWGQHSLLGAEIARDEINAAGGIGGVPLELIVADYASKADLSISLARKLTEQDKVLVIVGPILSSSCEMTFPVINRMNIVAVSPTSAAPGLSARNRPWAFRNNLTSDKTLGPALEKWVETYQIKTVGIIYDNSDAVSTGEGAKIFPAFFEKSGAKVIDSLTIQKKDFDFSAHITRLAAKNPDGVALAAQAEQAANIVREMRRQGLNVPVITGVECANPLFARTGKDDVEGVWTASATWADNPDPKVQEFVTAFTQRKDGEKPNSGGFKSYDTIYIIKDIILEYGITNDPKNLAKDRELMREGWKNVRDFPGVSGVTSIDEDGDGVSMPAILKINQGQWTVVE